MELTLGRFVEANVPRSYLYVYPSEVSRDAYASFLLLQTINIRLYALLFLFLL